MNEFFLNGNRINHSLSSKTVLIYADHRRRDAPSALLIAFYLKKLGYNTVIGNRLNTKSLFYKFKPDLMISTHPNAVFLSDELKIVAKNCIFVLMHPESSGMVREAMLDHMRGGNSEIGDSYSRHYSKVLTWGPQLKEWIVEAGLYNEDQVHEVGCVRYDFYLDTIKSKKLSKLGGMSSFTGISNFDNRNMFDLINSGRGQHGIHYGKYGGYEDYLWTSAAYVRLFLEFLDHWCLKENNEISFRPYTLENIDDFSFFKDRYREYISIDNKAFFSEWLSGLSANIFCYSSSVIESIISGTPYITLQNIIEDRLEFHAPRDILVETRGDLYNYTHRPQSIEELVELSKKAVKGELNMPFNLSDSPELQQLLSKYYGWPQKKPSSEIVAGIVDELLSEKPKNKLGLNFNNLESAKVTYRISREIVNKRWVTLDDYHFMPWHTKEKHYVKTVFDKLCEKNYE